MNAKQKLVEFWGYLSQEIDGSARHRVEKICKEYNESIPVVIADLGLASDENVVSALSQTFGIDVVDPNLLELEVDKRLTNSTFVKSCKILPLKSDAAYLNLAMVNPFDDDIVSGVEFATGLTVQKSVISLTDWRTCFDRFYGEGSSEAKDEVLSVTGRASWASDQTRLQDVSSDAPVIRKVDSLLTQAADLGASDVHVEPSPTQTRIRFRVDGQMRDPIIEAPDLARLIVSRVKVMCDMDVADSRRPQDGRTTAAIRGRSVDLRVSTVPTAYGESLAIRLLDRSASLLDLDQLGFSNHDLHLIESVLKVPKGIFLVTGPTGSGKTTTLYAALNRLRQVARKILTIEDPIEYFFDDVNQVQVNEAAGVGFASSLRSFLRQDPDIMMVGEIRDAETARVAIQAALTGHLVLSTLHTNDAASAIARLKDMGIEDYLIAATVSGITAQRLVRKKCQACPVVSEVARGCPSCGGSGYAGRVIISESYKCDTDMARVIREGGNEDAVFEAAMGQGMTPMLEDGRTKAKTGLVDLEDVYAAIGQD